MAIKVGGTTVIDDTRQLTNISGLDAATVTAFSDAGIGGGGTVELTAGENLTAGQAVVVNSSGQAVKILQTLSNPTVNNDNQIQGGDVIYFDAAYFPEANANGAGVIGLMYKRPSDGLVVEKRYTVDTSTGSISSAGDQVFLGNSADGFGIAMVYSTAAKRALFVQANSSNNTINYRGIHYTGTSVVNGASATISHNYSSSRRIALVYDESLDIFLMSADKSTGLPIYVLTLSSGGAVSNPATISSIPGFTNNFKFSVLATNGNGQFVMLADDAANGKQIAIAFTVDGNNSFTFGSVVDITTDTSAGLNDANSLAYDSLSGKFVCTVRTNNGTDMFALSVTNNVITKGTAVNVRNNACANMLIESGAGTLSVFYSTYSALNYRSVSVDSSGNITFGTNVVLSSSANLDTNRNFKVLSTDSNYSNFVSYKALYNKAYADLRENDSIQTVTSNSTNAVGFVSSQVSSGSPVEVTIIGGVNDQQTNLLAGTRYYINTAGSLTSSNTGVYAGLALSNTELLVKG